MKNQTLITRKDENVGDDIFDSIAWVFSEHVKEQDNPAFQSAILYGNEDAPSRIDFYTEENPLVTSKPARVWTDLINTLAEQAEG